MADALAPVESLRLLVQDEVALLPRRTYPLLTLLSKQDAFQRLIKWTANTGGATIGGRAVNAANAIAASTDVNRPARLDIGDRVMGHRFDVLRTDIVEARRTAPGALVNLFSAHVRTGMEQLWATLNEQLYIGDGSAASHGIIGLDKVASEAPADDTYAGINRVTYGLWDAYVDDNGGVDRALSRETLGTMEAALSRRGGSYDVIFTTPEIIEGYKQLFAEQPSTSVNVAPLGYADLGFLSIGYNGRPIISDPNCPTGEMHFVNSRGVSVHTFNLTGSAENSVQADSTKTMGLNILVAEIRNENPHVLSYEISTQPQLQVFNRRKDVAVLKDIEQ